MTNKVLAGPIIRRTTKSRVCVWIATSLPLSLELNIMDPGKKILAKGRMDSLNPQGICLGDNLYIHLLQARALSPEGFPLDTLMHYEINEIHSKKSTPLFSKDEISQICYGKAPGPSFFIPSELNTILHGSCRKPHGLCESDGLSGAHGLMERTCNNLKKRPALLLLTGDQIYADDVNISLLATLREKAIWLTGKPEILPQIDNLKSIPLHGRKKILEETHSGFSSSESHNHLFSFGEYAAMYLYAFGNYQDWKPLKDWNELRKHEISPREEENARKAFEEEKPYLEKFHDGLKNVRRLLANIPTYMIFDDHDVTDDWNITHYWYDKVRESMLGRRIVSNALAACWAFQSWGNDPDNFNKDMVWSIQQRMSDKTDNPAIAERFDLHTWKHRGWGFSVPSNPPVIAIDSRTQRQYDDYNLPAQLMDRYALDWLRVEWSKVLTDNDLPSDTWPILVAATPVLGFAPIEFFLKMIFRFLDLYMNKFGKKVPFLSNLFKGPIERKLVNVMDIESWKANEKGYRELFYTLKDRMKLKGCVFLSGDVHYSFSSEGEFATNESTMPCFQLTSSALNNMPSKTNQKYLRKFSNELPGSKDGPFFKWKKDWWSSSSNLIRPKENPAPIQTKSVLGMVRFSRCRPISHTLIAGKNQITYELKKN